MARTLHRRFLWTAITACWPIRFISSRALSCGCFRFACVRLWNQRCSGARDRYRTGADPVCHRRDGQSAELCSAGCFHPVYEPVFSIHYLTIYYLLQPYNAGTELKSGTYRIVLSVTYVVCFALMRLRMPIMIFGIMTIVFCVLYSIVASILVYRLAPKTFRLRT